MLMMMEHCRNALRMGYCYENGDGVAADQKKQKSFLL